MICTNRREAVDIMILHMVIMNLIVILHMVIKNQATIIMILRMDIMIYLMVIHPSMVKEIPSTLDWVLMTSGLVALKD